MHELLFAEVARQQIKEKIKHASAPRVRNHRRHQLAGHLRRVADRLEG